MALFSERNGYIQPREVIIRESMPREIVNGICSVYDNLYDRLDILEDGDLGLCPVSGLEEYLWVHFFNKRLKDYSKTYKKDNVSTAYILSDAIWYKKLDLIELSISYMRENFNDVYSQDVFYDFIDSLNDTFKRLGYAYRVIDNEIVEITSEEEIIEIENALSIEDTIANHISTSLSLLSQRPDGDYRNSIKESISAVEVICRYLTGTSTLGDALKEIKKKGLSIPGSFESAFLKLYSYTNDKTTGIRHALMDNIYEPGYDEAKFMLIACSAFVNYLRAKSS